MPLGYSVCDVSRDDESSSPTPATGSPAGAEAPLAVHDSARPPHSLSTPSSLFGGLP